VTLLLLALACDGEQAAAPAATPPATPPAAAALPAAPTPVVWNVDTIDQLVPVAPARATTVGRALPADPAYDRALQALGGVVETYAGDPDNPWAIAHGVLARGTDFRLVDGRPAVPHLFSTYAEPRTVGTRTLLGFPRSLGTVRVEPHTDLLLKNLGEVGVAPDAVYPTRHGVHNNGDAILPDAAVTLAEVLKEKGYGTAASVSAFVTTRMWNLDQGFDDYFDTVEKNPSSLITSDSRSVNASRAWVPK
jgi:hypothetical protein